MATTENFYSWEEKPVTPGTMSAGYRIGLAVVAIAMILLPLCYVALCLSAAYGIYLYAVDEPGLMSYHQPGLVAYFGPILAGCIGLVFMVKPLFTSQKKIEAHLVITRQTEPELFRFIEEICTRVGAPMPVRVLVDNQVNASASFEHGWWGVVTNRLVLTIGLPLAQGLTVSQLGGVFAHEFGHFTQAAAMRFNYVIRSTNGWFSRVIYERDAWDAKLTAWSKRGNVYWIIMANIAVAFVWLARKILWCLMRAGHAVSSYMMRQMEYDADHYEKEIAGTANFKETFLRLHLINAGTRMTGTHLNQLWKGGRLVDNLPHLTRHLTETIAAPAVQSLRASFDSEQNPAHWHSTHPSDFQRIHHPTQSSEAGILHGDQSATCLFADFGKLAEAITLIEYQERFELKFKAEALIPTETYLAENSERGEKLARMNAFFAGLLSEHRLLFPVNPGSLESSSPEVWKARLEACTSHLEARREESATVIGNIEKARSARAGALVAQALREMGLPVKAADYGLPDLKPGSIAALVEGKTREIAQGDAALLPARSLAQEKFYLRCRLAQSLNPTPARVLALENFLLAIQPISLVLSEQRKAFFRAAIFLEKFQAAKDKKRTEALFEAEANSLKQAIQRIEALAEKIGYPLNDGKAYPHLNAYFVTGNTQPGSVGFYLLMRAIYERFDAIYVEVMLELLDAPLN